MLHGQFLWCHTGAGSVEETQASVGSQGEAAGASESQPLTLAFGGTADVTHPLVIVLRAVLDSITHVFGVKAHARGSTPIVIWTLEAFTIQLVFLVRAVVYPVTAGECRHAKPVTTTGAKVMGFLAGPMKTT
jgi:hypothetical protein